MAHQMRQPRLRGRRLDQTRLERRRDAPSERCGRVQGGESDGVARDESGGECGRPKEPVRALVVL